MSTELCEALETMARRGSPGGGDAVVDRALDAVPTRRSAMSSRKTGRSLLAIAAVLVVAVGATTAVYIRSRVDHIRRLDLARALDTPVASGPINLLLVSSDTQAAFPNTDSIVVLRVDFARNRLSALWVPRDVYVASDGGRIGNLLDDPSALIDAVRAITGISVDHFASIEADGFRRIVDTAGGVNLRVDAALRDQISGLSLAPGCDRLDGDAALAYIRSRHLQVRHADGSFHADPTGDLGRIARQQSFFLAALRQAGASARNPVKLNRVVGAATDSITTDDGLSLKLMLRIWKAALSDAGAPAVAVVPTRTVEVGEQAVLEVEEDALPATINAFEAQDVSVPPATIGAVQAEDCG